MKTTKYLLYFVLCPFVLFMTSCEPDAVQESSVFVPESEVEQILENKSINPEGAHLYTLHEFLDAFMTEKGNFASDTCPYRTRATNGTIYLYSVDTLRPDGEGIYIKGRVCTDDFAGNFYKSMVIQQVVDGQQQCLRVGVDMGSLNGMFQLGQEILIRCNGLAVGRYANQPQLCVPSYNNNIFAMNANQKVGWCPGRIPAARFRNAVTMIGVPDQSKLKYDTITLAKLIGGGNVTPLVPFKPKATIEDMQKVRYADGMLITLEKVYFTGQANDNGTATDCKYQHPDSSGLANVFAPTTLNIGYPQSRILKQRGNSKVSICCSCSEYCKFSHFFLPGARADEATAVKYCKSYTGTVTGILGWYQDNAADLSVITGNEWSLTPRGIPGIGIEDIKMYTVDDYTGEISEWWVPQEFDPRAYKDRNQ